MCSFQEIFFLNLSFVFLFSCQLKKKNNDNKTYTKYKKERKKEKEPYTLFLPRLIYYFIYSVHSVIPIFS